MHALVTDGLLRHGGALLPQSAHDLAALEELFRGLVRTRRLSETFRDGLLAWRDSGFGAYGEQVVRADE